MHNEIPPNDRQDKLIRFFYHLGKGLWKSLPILGPIVEEVIYEQFKDEVTKKVVDMSEEQLSRYLQMVPKIDMEALDTRLTMQTDDLRMFSAQQFAVMLNSIEDTYLSVGGNLDRVKDVLDEVKGDTEQIPNILNELETLRANLDQGDKLRATLDAIEKKRQHWVKRISDTQRRVLTKLPADDFVMVDDLWEKIKTIIPLCTYKEFRFRLHELEWLALVERERRNGSWYYRRNKHLEV